jgi:hypothetical protein
MMSGRHPTELLYPRLRDVERELYPTLDDLYAELARPTPRPVVRSRPMQAASIGEAAQPLKGKGSR